MSDPEIIREDAPHQVTMSDHSNVAVSKTGDPAAASVRKVLVEEEPEARLQDVSPTVHRELAPEVPAASGVHRELAPETPAGSGVHRELAPETPVASGVHRELAPDVPSASGVHRERVPEDVSGSSVHRELVPEGRAAPTSDGVAVPPPLAQAASNISVPGGLATDQTAVEIPASAGTERPTLEIPVGEASARPLLELPPSASASNPPAPGEAAGVKALLADLNVPEVEQLEEQLGEADAVWVEMDFPARVVKLKIENDKVRQKLDVLERAAGSPR